MVWLLSGMECRGKLVMRINVKFVVVLVGTVKHLEVLQSTTVWFVRSM